MALSHTVDDNGLDLCGASRLPMSEEDCLHFFPYLKKKKKKKKKNSLLVNICDLR